MAGGKQKRAAKYKKWIQNKQASDSGGEKSDLSENNQDDLAAPEGQPISERIRHDVLKHRKKKVKGSSKGNWINHQFDRLWKSVEIWPKWPFTFLMITGLYLLVFYLLRTAIQTFVSPNVNMDRTGLYNGLKNVAPKFVYKLFLMMDYLFTARELSLSRLYEIVFPPEDYYNGPRVPLQKFRTKTY